MTSESKKLPHDKFVIARSEDVYNGRTLLKVIGKSKNKHYEVDMIVYEIDNDGDMYKGFGIIPGNDEYRPYSKFSELSNQFRKKIISSLFRYGIKDER